MPFSRSKKERAVDFARAHGEAKAKLEPDNEGDYLINSNADFLSEKCKDGTPYNVEIAYEHYRPWPDCPWPDPWRVTITNTVSRKAIGYPDFGGSDFISFSVFGDFCENREQALQSAQIEMNSERTF